MVGLLSLPEQSHLAAVLRSLMCVPKNLGEWRKRRHQVESTGYQRQKRGGGKGGFRGGVAVHYPPLSEIRGGCTPPGLLQIISHFKYSFYSFYINNKVYFKVTTLHYENRF